MTKDHSFSDSAWSTLWTDRWTSYSQSGSGNGGGSKSASYHQSVSGYTLGDWMASDDYNYTGWG